MHSSSLPFAAEKGTKNYARVEVRLSVEATCLPRLSVAQGDGEVKSDLAKREAAAEGSTDVPVNARGCLPALKAEHGKAEHSTAWQ